MVHWFVKAYHDLTKDELYEILKVRQLVFICEQNIVYADCDDRDQDALHFVGQKEIDGIPKIVAYSRIFPPGKKYADEVAFGRVLTTHHVRGQGVGKQLVANVVEYISEHYPKYPIRISAQAHLEHFYQTFGFKAVGLAYIEENISHLDMWRE